MRKSMKIFSAILLFSLVALVLTGCGANNDSSDEVEQSSSTASSKESIVIGTTATIESISQEVASILNDEGYDVQVEVFQDAMATNEALDEGKIDLNYIQHEIYMESFNESRGAELVKVGDALYNQQVGIFSETYSSIDEIENGALIAIDNNPVNMDRAIKVLADAGLISYDESIEENGQALSVFDITENPKNLEFKEVSGSALVKTMEDTDAAMFSGQMAASAGYGPEDALALYERDDLSQYGMILATKSGNETMDWAQATYEAYKSQPVQDVIAEEINGMWTPNF